MSEREDLYLTFGPWVALGIVLVLIGSVGPSGSQFVRRTLVVILAYLLLTRADQIAPLVDKLIRGLKGV